MTTSRDIFLSPESTVAIPLDMYCLYERDAEQAKHVLRLSECDCTAEETELEAWARRTFCDSAQSPQMTASWHSGALLGQVRSLVGWILATAARLGGAMTRAPRG